MILIATAYIRIVIKYTYSNSDPRVPLEQGKSMSKSESDSKSKSERESESESTSKSERAIERE